MRLVLQDGHIACPASFKYYPCKMLSRRVLASNEEGNFNLKQSAWGDQK